MTREELHQNINDIARNLGFSEYGAAPFEKLSEDIERLKVSINFSFNADMKYLEKNIDIRENPSLLLDNTKSVMCFLAQYKQNAAQVPNSPLIASYAYGKDYHKVIKDKLHSVALYLNQILPDLKYRVFVDSAPILERAWAAKAGLGFIGKNTMLINKNHGVKTFIGIILINKELIYGELKKTGGCGNCRNCIESCPTGALCGDYTLDARKCISYQTIESRRDRDLEDNKIDFCNNLFGCDICINACPWSNKGLPTTINEFTPNSKLMKMTKEDWLELDQETFIKEFSDTALLRAGLSKIKNNLL